MRQVLVNTKSEYDSRDFFNSAIVESDGAIKWESNGRYLDSDIVSRVIANGFSEFSVEATKRKRKEQVSATLSNYKSRPVDINELRANFSKGTTVYDVISGDSIKL